MKDIEKYIDRKINQAVLKYKLISPGDRVLLAVSGGKDSMSLAYFLSRKAGSRYHIDFDIHAVHVKTDFSNTLEDSGFEQYMAELNIPYTVIDVPVLARLKPGRKMNCYWCSSQRRMELMKFADREGYDKIALGHHMDDILETFFMNMAYKGEMSAMLPLMKFDNYEQTIIRPLSLVKEREIIEFADLSGISKLTCTCSFDTNSKRKEAREIVEYMAGKDESIRENLFKALNNPVPRYMISHDQTGNNT